MGFPQRQYTTSLNDYDKLKEIIRKKRGQEVKTKTDLYPEKEKGRFTFHLKDFPQVRIQITSRNYFLHLFNVKHDNYVQDLKIIGKLVSLFASLFPREIYFQLHKSSYGDRDKDAIIEGLEGQIRLIMDLNHYLLLTSPGAFKNCINEHWKSIQNNSELRDTFIEHANNYFARAICEDGFYCKTDGSLKVDLHRNKISLANHLAMLIIIYMGVEKECYLTKYYYERK